MDPVLIDVPARIETARLLLRCPQPGDGAAVNAAVAASIDDLRPWMQWARTAPTVAESEAWCRRQQARFLLREDLVWLIHERGIGGSLGMPGALVGAVGLHAPDWTLRAFEIGYWARTGHAGQGYISEAVRALERTAFEHLGARRLAVRMDERNDASQRVAEAAGFEFEAVLRGDRLGSDGRPGDTRVYAKVATAGTLAVGDRPVNEAAR